MIKHFQRFSAILKSFQVILIELQRPTSTTKIDRMYVFMYACMCGECTSIYSCENLGYLQQLWLHHLPLSNTHRHRRLLSLEFNRCNLIALAISAKCWDAQSCGGTQSAAVSVKQ